MKTILFLICLSCTVLSAKSQNNFVADREPYVRVDSFEVRLKYLVLNNDKIESISILKDSGAIAKYGEKAKDGAVIIQTKPGTSFLRVNQVMDQYELSPEDRRLRVCINKTLVDHPEQVLIEKSEIKGVEVTTDWFRNHTEVANNREKFINIQTSTSLTVEN